MLTADSGSRSSDLISGRHLVLASASPRRHVLLSQIGLPFDTHVPAIEEPVLPASVGSDLDLLPAVTALAELKARAAAAELGPRLRPGTLIVGADTTVLLDRIVLGKPVDMAEAAHMLSMLSGRVHTVFSAVVVAEAGGRGDGSACVRIERGIERTRVFVAPLAPSLIDAYVSTGEPMDKAGAYAVQGIGSAFIERLEGCYFNVVGLPLALLIRLLGRYGVEVTDAWQTATISHTGGLCGAAGYVDPRTPGG